MKAYCLFDVREVIDPEGLHRYTQGVLETVQAFGGRYLHVGGKCHVLEGGWAPEFLVLIEFPGIEEARAWYDSPQYADLRALRLGSSRGDGVIVEPEAGALRDHLVGKA
jgi:uncharacterized protein (DUF1330 family)